MERVKQLLWSIQERVKNHQNRLILAISFILVAVLSFEAGFLRQSLVTEEPLVIQVPAVSAESQSSSTDEIVTESVPSTTAPPKTTSTNSTCFFVGSKKSNKYHHPLSRCAKQIKPANQRCFATLEDAKAKGYVPGCLEP